MVKKRKTKKPQDSEFKPTSKRAKTGVKRPLSAYMLYSKEIRPELVKKYPGERITEIAKRLGKGWHALTDEQKNKYKKMADAAKLAVGK